MTARQVQRAGTIGERVMRNATQHERSRQAWLLALAGSLVLLSCGGCHSDEPSAPQATANGEAAAPLTAVQHEPLPRAIAGVSLGMSLADAEAKLGPLSCHEAASGCRVCKGAQEQINGVNHLELYIHRDRVISLSYEDAVASNARGLLDRLIERYGRPTLSGVRERDKSGRVHEVYGWKDDQSLYSVRLIWQDNESGGSDLVGTAIAMWDRKGYQQWEAETHHGEVPTPATGDPQSADLKRTGTAPPASGFSNPLRSACNRRRVTHARADAGAPTAALVPAARRCE
jgi:hypothetical protein